MQNDTYTFEKSSSSWNVKHRVTKWSSNCTLGIYPGERKTYIHTKTGKQIFIGALLIIAKKQKLLKCPSTCLSMIWITKTGIAILWNIIWQWKGMKY